MNAFPAPSSSVASALLSDRNCSPNRLVLSTVWIATAGGVAVRCCEVFGHARPVVQLAAPVSLLVGNLHECQRCGRKSKSTAFSGTAATV